MSDVITIGIAGGTGSGKTTITRRILDEFGGDVSVLYHDNYYKRHDDIPFAERKKLNYDHPNAFDTPLLVQHLDALRAGKFYASRGPRIHNVVRERRTFTVDCDEGTVVFLSNACWSSGRVFENCTHAEYTAKDNESWIRVEVVDKNGRKAWTGVYSL